MSVCGLDDYQPGSSAGGNGGNVTTVGGGGSGGAEPVCSPGETRDCYTGADGTEGVGVCESGLETCADDGSAFLACEGETIPQPAADCASSLDVACDGDPDKSGCAAAGCFVAFEGDDETFVVALAEALDGGLVIAGEYEGRPDFGTGPLPQSDNSGGQNPERDGYILKADRDCNVDWVIPLDADDELHANGVAVGDDGAVYVGGHFLDDATLLNDWNNNLQPDGYVVKIDPGGTLLWDSVFTLAGAATRVNDLALTPDGDVVVTGDVDGNGQDIMVAKLDGQDGQVLWLRSFPAAGNQSGLAIAVGADGTLFAGGTFRGTLELDGSIPSNGGNDDGDSWLAAFDADGEPLWSRAFGTFDNDRIDALRSLAWAPDGTLVASGESANDTTFGDTTHPTMGREDVWLARFDTTGEVLFSQAFGSANTDSSQSAAVAGDGALWLAVHSNASIDFGDGPVPSGNGQQTLFVSKRDANGELIATRFVNADNRLAGSLTATVDGGAWFAARYTGALSANGQVFDFGGEEHLFFGRFEP